LSDFLLATKIHIPAVHGNLVSRQRLIQRLNDGLAQNQRLTLTSAPAGYGKSTLLSEWVSQLDLPVAWLSLEARENQPVRFWTYFLAALSTLPHLHQAGVGEGMRQALQFPEQPPVDVLLDNLVNDLAKLEQRAVLVLDDLHAITESQIHHDPVYLIDHLPQSDHSLRLVVASRSDPPWPLARWRVRKELSELRPVDLRFSYDETVQLLNQVLRLGLTPHDLAALQERTEGWIAGLQMAAVTMQARLTTQGAQGVSRFIENFTGTNRFIVDYLMEEVISQQPEERRDFLQATSILEQFTASLCDALLERQDSQAMLDQVDQANLFLIPLDDERQWYRYHHLFAELLRKSLKQAQPERITELHQRASEWYAENNFLAEAISHALDAGDVVRLNKFISGNALAMAEHAELQDVLRHFEQMPEEQICSKPWLCVAYAWVKAYVEPSREMDRILVKAMQSVNEVDDALERQQLTSHLDAVWAYVAWVKGKADLALEFVHTALENLPEDDWMTRSHSLNIKGLALQYLDHLPEAVQSFEAAVAAGQKTGRPYESFHAYTNWAFAEILRGRLHQAYSLSQYILNLADQSGFYSKGLPVLSYAYANMSIIQCEWNQVESAVALARQSVTLAERWSQADTLHFSLTCLSEALRAAGDLEAAFAANRRSMQLAVNVSPWFVKLSAYGEIMLNLANGEVAAAARRFAEVEATVEEEGRKGSFLIPKAALLNAQGHFSDTLSTVDQVIGEIEQNGKMWVMMKLLPHQALALQALGRQEEALEVLSRCLAFAEEEGYVRAFVEQGAPMLKLLQAVSHRGVHTEYINRLLPALKIAEISQMPVIPKTQPKDQIPTLLEPLSERELQVLRLLDSPLTSEEIGQELYISTNTVRTHIKNIYSKLGVNRRAEAVHLAKVIKLT